LHAALPSRTPSVAAAAADFFYSSSSSHKSTFVATNNISCAYLLHNDTAADKTPVCTLLNVDDVVSFALHHLFGNLFTTDRAFSHKKESIDAHN